MVQGKHRDMGGIVAGLSLISTNLSFIHREDLMPEAVKRMAERKVSSLLVHDNEERVVGIITERDVVRKYAPALIHSTSHDGSYLANIKVGTVMTFPLVCASATNFSRDIPRLHAEFGIRHFPIVRGQLVAHGSPLVRDVIGIVSVTDLARQYLKRLARKGPGSAKEEITSGSAPVRDRIRLTILSSDPDSANFYSSVFEQLDFDIQVERLLPAGFARHLTHDSCVLLEFDSFSAEDQKNILAGLPAWTGQVVVATAREDLIDVFRKHLHSGHQHVALKPLNLTRCAAIFAGS